MLADIEFDLGLEESVDMMKEIVRIFNGRKAFFVLGCEGSGTHMARNALVEAGCHWEQRFENVKDERLDFMDCPSPLVIRRSLPHAHRWPDLEAIHVALENAEYEIHVVFMVRDFNASAKSVVRRGYGLSEEGNYENQRFAFIKLGEYLDGLDDPFTYVTYEAFCFSAGFRKWLFEDRFGLTYPQDFQIFEGNSQYYE